MGIWGTGPFDNDAAGDMVAGLSEIVNKVVNPKDPKKASYYYTDARAAAQFVLAAHATDILGGPSLVPVVKLLARMRMDDDWIGSFRRPVEIARELEAELLTVMSRMRDCKGCRRFIKKTERRGLETLAETACAHPTPPRRVHVKR